MIIFDEFVKNNWPDNDKFQFKNDNYNLENVELKKYFRTNHMYPRKIPEGLSFTKNPLLRLFTEIPKPTLVKKCEILSQIFFQNFIFRILFNVYEIFWNGSFDWCFLQFWSNCNFECRLRVVAVSFEEELREHFATSDCELFVQGWLVEPTTFSCYASHPLLGWSEMVSVALGLHASPSYPVSLPQSQWWSRMTSKEL